MTSITGEDGTIITVAEGAWSSVESPNPTQDRFIELGKLPADKQQQLNEWLSKVAAVVSSFPLCFLFFEERCSCCLAAPVCRCIGIIVS